MFDIFSNEPGFFRAALFVHSAKPFKNCRKQMRDGVQRMPERIVLSAAYTASFEKTAEECERHF